MDNDLKQNSNTSDDEIDLVEVIKTIWQGRKLIFLVTTIFLVVGILYAFLATPVYQAKITLYPAGESQNGGLGKFGGLASSFGLGGMSSSSGYYIPDIVKSRKILNKVIFHKWKSEFKDRESINLLYFWDFDEENLNKRKELALKKIHKQISVTTDTESDLITIAVNMKDGKIAADIANFIGEEVNNYIQNEQISTARQGRIFVEKRLVEVKGELRSVEEKLKEFRTVNRIISQSPDLQMEYSRLISDVEIKKQICLTLEQQKELAMIEEVKKMPVLNIIDNAVKPETKLKPKKILIIFFSGIMGIVIGVIFLLLMNVVKRWRVVLKLG